ncbi:Peptidase B [Serratia marcescens]|uniref:Peptidase B n=1 Tax=Serratia marcescens TaxID=615 RepID=A0A379YTA2_SERMA|nr:Peptidase B [Serratia marcescens]
MTTEFMQVMLSQQPADARWGEKALLSTNGEGMTIHLTGADKLGAIQRAGRKIDGQGIKNVKLAGDGWDLENSWAFWQGYRGPKGQRNVEWADLPEAARQELDKRLKIVDWVRDTINMPAEELGPEQLATRAVDLMCDVGCDAVSYRITKGEDSARAELCRHPHRRPRFRTPAGAAGAGLQPDRQPGCAGVRMPGRQGHHLRYRRL